MSVVVANYEIADQLEVLAGDLVGALSREQSDHNQRCAALHGALSVVSASAHEAGLRAVPALLRLLQSGLVQFETSHMRVADDERDLLVLWLVQLSGYCAGSMDASQHPKLLDTLTAVPWIPEVAPRMREFILMRIIESAPVASEPEPDAIHSHAGFADDEAILEIGVEHFEEMADAADLAFELPHGDTLGSAEPMFADPVQSRFGDEGMAFVEFTGSEFSAASDPIEQPPLRDWDIEDEKASAFGDEGALAFVTEFAAAPDTWAQPDAADAAPDLEPVTAIEDDAIWIASEEFDLAGSAIASQLIPLTQEFFVLEEGAEQTRVLAELEFHTGLVGNAFEVLSLPRLWALTTQVQALLRPIVGRAPPPPDLLVAWQAAMLGFLSSPDRSSSKLLCQMAAELVGDFDQLALSAELARIRVGMDPRRMEARKREGSPEDVSLEIAPDVLPSVLDGMLRELPGNASRLGESIRNLVAGGSADDLAEARRFAHTLKGDANTVGLRGLANLTHALEDIMLELTNTAEPPRGALADVLTESADTVEVIADYVLRRGPAPEDLLSTFQRVLDAANTLFFGKVAAAAAASAVPASRRAAAPEPEMARAGDAIAAGTKPERVVEASHTVAVSLLNELLRLAGETIVLMRQVEQRVKGVSEVYRELLGQNRGNRDLVAQLDDLVALRGAALKSARLAGARDVDPLELDQYTELHVVSRRLIESNSDQVAFMQRMDGDLLTLDDLLSMQERTQGDLQRLVLRTRTIPLSNVSGRLQRVVRQVARQLLKSVELDIVGANTEIDSELLDRIVEPLSHILRNAVDHGIESPEDRTQAGKSEVGRIQLSVAMQGDAIEFVIVDDGRGLDLDAVRQRALEMGVLAPEDSVSDEELARLVMLPGFSTKLETTQVSGRGIGMDVVAQRVSDLRGNVALRSSPGQGLEIRIRLPASLTSANVVLARDEGERVAAVAASVARIVALEPKDFQIADDGRLYVDADGELYPAIPLAALFDGGRHGWSAPDLRRTGLIVDAVGMEPYIVYAERVDEVRNVVVKNLGTYLAPIAALRGVTILGDGGIAPVLDLAQSVQEMARVGDAHRVAIEPGAGGAAVPRIVIADDSLSVRRALEQLMQDAGYSVVTARDGVEALDAIRDTTPIAALLDLEMPRLNGLDVTRFLRNQAETAHLPVVMITSRATDKYRVMAQEAGVTHLIGKPFDEDELVLLVRQSIAAAAEARTAPES